jgi:PAS domain S-box-containing protein
MNPYRILIVEDEAIVAMNIEERLAGMGYQPAGRAASGEQALADAQIQCPDLVLMDIQLQGTIDGITAAEEMRKRFHIPVIFLTAYSEDATLDRAKLVQPYGYILKPFDDRELKSAIEIALYKHQAEQEIRRLNRLYNVLSQVNQAIVRTKSREELLETICRLVVERGEINLAWISKFDQATNHLSTIAHFGEKCDFLRRAYFYADDTPEGQGAPGKAVKEGTSFVCNHCGRIPCLFPAELAQVQFGFQSCGSFPLRFQDRIFGVLNLAVSEAGFFREKEIQMLEEVALDISFALDNIEKDAERERIEAALRQSEARYRKLFEDATEGIALADSKSGEILDCNRAFLQLTEYAREELIGKSQAMLHPKSDIGAAAVTRTFAQHREEKDGSMLPATLITKSGAVKQVEIKAHVLDIGNDTVMQAFFRDVTEYLRYNSERETTLELLRILNERDDIYGLIHGLTDFLQRWTGCDAVGVRLRDGDDYPYLVTKGFPSEFLQLENSLCLRNENGQIERDCDGNPVLECMCGNILCGRFNPALPFFTAKGSFWTNSTTNLLANTSKSDRQGRTRNRCNGEGYESVALFALRHGAKILGLLQVNDRAKNRFTPELINFLENAADQIAIALAQRQTQADLQASEERYRLLVENAAEVVAVAQDGMLRFVNPQAEAVSGYSREELMARPFSEFIHPDDQLRSELNHQRRLRDDLVLEEDEIRILCKDGEVRWLHLKAQRISWNGSPATLNFYTDITETKKAEEEKETLKTQLFQAQKMESVGRLAGGIAHDFNNMLSVIIGNADAALEKMNPENPFYQDFRDIQSAGRRSADLTRQLLAFARKQTISPRVLDLNETIGSMTKMLLRMIGEDIHLTWNPSHSLWKVKVDPSQIDQIMANLAVNARDAIPCAGQVTIKTANYIIDDIFCKHHLGAVPGEYAMVAFSDSGAGMSTEILEHIFEPFFTTKEVGKGTGLGLATIYGIVKQNNGFIDVASEPGNGTTFRIYFPRHTGEVKGSADESDSTQRFGGNETILLVEDESMVRDLAGRILKQRGYSVLEAANGIEALSAARGFQGEIHLVLTDVVMPRMGGKAMLAQLKAERPGIKAIYISGYADNSDISDPGADFIHKPFTIETLVRKVRETLNALT